MANPKYNSYDKKKNDDAFAINLRELAPNSEAEKELAAALGCTQNAIKQFKAGKSFPQPRNLVNIARYYKCSLDYLIGLSTVKSTEATVQSISEYTGLSESAILALHRIAGERSSEERRPLSFINRCFEDPDVASGNTVFGMLSLLEQYVTSSSVQRRVYNDYETKKYETAEEYREATKQQEIYSRTVMIESSDEVSELLTVGQLYREAKMTEIRKELEALRKEEEKK